MNKFNIKFEYIKNWKADPDYRIISNNKLDYVPSFEADNSFMCFYFICIKDMRAVFNISSFKKRMSKYYNDIDVKEYHELY